LKLLLYFILLVVLTSYVNCFNSSYIFDIQFSHKPDSAGFYFLHRISDSSLFSNDLLALKANEHFGIFSGISVVWAIYAALMHIFSLAVSIKIVSMLLCILGTIVIFKIGRYLYNKDTALLLSGIFFLYFNSSDIFMGGQLRAFGAVLFCIFLMYFIKGKYLILPFILLLAFFIYPPIFSTLFIICVMILFLRSRRLSWKLKYTLCIASVMAVVFFDYNFGTTGMVAKGVLDNRLIFSAYKYTQGVNFSLDPYNPIHALLYFIFNFNEYSVFYIYSTGLLLFLSFVFIVIKKRRAFFIPKQLWLILLASVLSFLLLYPINPAFASKQFVFSLPIFLVFFTAINISDLTKTRIDPIFILLPLMITYLILQPLYGATLDHRKYKDVYAYMESLPKNILIAGEPGSVLLDSIPLFSKRTVFLSSETRDINLYVYTKEEIIERNDDLIKALHLFSPAKLLKFISKYNIDYFIIEDRFYKKIPGAKESTFLDLARENYDVAFEVNGNFIYVLSSKKIKNKYGYLADNYN